MKPFILFTFNSILHSRNVIIISNGHPFMERLYTKRVDFSVVDAGTTTTDVTELEEVFRYHHPMQCQLNESPSVTLHQGLQRYGHRMCPRSEVCQTTQTKNQPLCLSEIPSDESYSDIISMVLKVYGEQYCKGRKFCRGVSRQCSTADLGGVKKASKTTQTVLAVTPVEKQTNTREYDASVTVLKGVCFRQFLGPSLDESGVYFGENLSTIQRFWRGIKDKVFMRDATVDGRAVRHSSKSKNKLLWDDKVGRPRNLAAEMFQDDDMDELESTRRDHDSTISPYKPRAKALRKDETDDMETLEDSKWDLNSTISPYKPRAEALRKDQRDDMESLDGSNWDLNSTISPYKPRAKALRKDQRDDMEALASSGIDLRADRLSSKLDL